VRDAIRAEQTGRIVGAKLFFLPRYSPDLNPIEQVFAKLKTLLRKTDPRTIEATWRGIGQLLDRFTPQECNGIEEGDTRRVIRLWSHVSASSCVAAGRSVGVRGSRRLSGRGGSARVFQFFLREKPFHRAAGRIGLSGLRLTALRFRRLGFELQPHELLPNFRSQRIVTIFAAVALAARRPGPHSDMI